MFARYAIATFLTAFVGLAELRAAETTSTPDLPKMIEMEDPGSPPEGVVSPRPTGSHDITMAQYPRESFVAGEEGDTKLRLTVAEDGSVNGVQVESSSGSKRLDDAAISFVRQWRYEPATQNGVRIAAKFPVIVHWRLYLSAVTFPAGLSAQFYPPISVRLGEQGTVGIRFLVLEDGTVATVAVTKSSGHTRLDDAAALMAKRYWHFKPAKLVDGSPVGVWAQTNIVFELR